MVIDFHTHCFPDNISSRAMEKLSFVSGGLKHHTNGTYKDLINSMKINDVDISVVLNIATNEKQQKNVNDFAASINNEKNIFSFGSVYPHSDDALDELDRIKSLGLKGVKLHPDYQKFSVDDDFMKPIYKKISSLGLILVFHSGLDYGFSPPYGCTPKKLSKALNWIDCPVVAAHWGALNLNEEFLKYLCGKSLFIDTSFGYGSMPKYYAQTIVDKHGADKILFGTDLPWHTAKMEKTLLNTLDIDNDSIDKIMFKNAKRLLNI